MKVTSSLFKARVLIVDDDPAIHDGIRTILENVTGTARLGEQDCDEVALPGRLSFVIDSAYQGQHGVDLIRAAVAAGQPYSVAFVDMRMPPGWDGIETVGRAWEEDPGLQIVICTADSNDTWNGIAGRIGHSDQLLFLEKPFDPLEVCQLVMALTEKRRLAEVSALKMDQLERMVAERTAKLAQLNEEIQASESRFRQLADNLGDVFWLESTSSHELIYINPAFEKIWQRPIWAVLRDPRRVWRESVHPEDRQRAAGIFVADDSERQSEAEFRILHGDGAVRWIRARSFKVHDAQGRAYRIAGIAQDITEFRLAHDQLQQAQKLEAIGQLAAGIAHEINTPAQFVTENSRFLHESFEDLRHVLMSHERILELSASGALSEAVLEEARHLAERVELGYLRQEIPKAIAQSLDGMERITSIVESMREFSHFGESTMCATNLAAALQSTITVCRNEWRLVADVVTEFEEDLPPVPCVMSSLNQAFLNVIVNAAHAIAECNEGTRGMGVITVGARRDGDEVEVYVRDTGGGIPEKLRSRIYNPFFTTKGVGRGTGQGLSMAWSTVVERHSGRLYFETALGKGTTFFIRLPLHPPEPAAVS